MFSAVAHEINNPLMIISNIISMLIDDIEEKQSITIKKGDGTYKDMLNVLESCNRISKNVKSLQQFQQRSSNEKIEEAYIHRLILRSVQFLEPLLLRNNIQANIKIESDISDFKCYLKRNLIEQLFINILENCIYAILQKRVKLSENGDSGEYIPSITIEVTTKNIGKNEVIISSEDAMFTQNAKPDIEFLHIEFQDNGIGLSEEVKIHLGNMFYTTKKTQESQSIGLDSSLGLGIAFCVSALKEHGGILTYESEYNAYSKFHIYLPLSLIEKSALTEANTQIAEINTDEITF